MSNVTIKDFHVGESAWSIEHFGNTKEIVEGKVVKVGRKYVTMDGFGRQYAELPGGGEYLTDHASCGYTSCLFPSNRLHRNLSRKRADFKTPKKS